MSTAQDKVNQIAALIDAWRQNDSPEGEMSAGWVLGQIREALGPVLLTEEEAQRISESVMQAADTDKDHVQTLREALLVRFGGRGEIPPEVRQGEPVLKPGAQPIDPDSGARETWHRDQAVVVRTEPRLDVEAAKKAAKQTEERLRRQREHRPVEPETSIPENPEMCDIHEDGDALIRSNRCARCKRFAFLSGFAHRTDAEEQELQTTLDWLKSQNQDPGWAIAERVSAETAVVLGTGDDAGPASEEMDS